MVKQSLSLAALLATVALAGCGMQPGKSEVKYNRGDTARMSEASQDGIYALYGSSDATPLVRYTLTKGDKLGFKKLDDGSVVAVAGTNETPIATTAVATRTFYWKMQKE